MQNAEIESYLANGALPDGSEVAYLSAPGADFSQSIHSHCSFRSVDLSRGDFRGAKFKNCTFLSIDLTGALMEGAEFEDCEFIGCGLTQIAAHEASFTRCAFLQSNLLAAYLERARFEDCTFEACSISSLVTQTIAAGAVFDQVTFRSSSLECLDADSAHFLACKMDTVSLAGAILSGANIYLSVLESVDLSAAYLDASTVEDSLVAGNMNGTDLSMALLKNSDLTGVSGVALINDDTEIIESALAPQLLTKEEN